MEHYVKITKHLSDDSLAEQLQQIVNDKLFDSDLRVFFPKSNMLTTEDIAYMLKFFDIGIDWVFDSKNIVFTPTKYAVRRCENNQLMF